MKRIQHRDIDSDSSESDEEEEKAEEQIEAEPEAVKNLEMIISTPTYITYHLSRGDY